MFLLASQTASVINKILQPVGCVCVCGWAGPLPWVLPKTTSLHSVCVLSCWPPQGPYTPPYHRRNTPSYQHPPTLYSGQSLHSSKGNIRILSKTDDGKSWRSGKRGILPVNFICPASSSKMLKEKKIFSWRQWMLLKLSMKDHERSDISTGGEWKL